MVHRYALKVRFYELDPYNHVNHSAIIQYFEVGRVELLESIGFGLDAMKTSGHHIVVTRIETRFKKSAGPGDELVVETVVDEIRRATSVWSQLLLCGPDLIAEQSIHAAVTDVEGRPRRFPTELGKALEPHLADSPG